MTAQLGGHTASPGAYDPLDLQLDRLGTPAEPVDAAQVPARTRSEAVEQVQPPCSLSLASSCAGIRRAREARSHFSIRSCPWRWVVGCGPHLKSASRPGSIAAWLSRSTARHRRCAGGDGGNADAAPLLIDDSLARGLALALGVCASTSSLVERDALTRSRVAQVHSLCRRYCRSPRPPGHAPPSLGAIETMLNTDRLVSP